MAMSVVAVVPKPTHRFEGGGLVLLFHAVFEVSARYCFEPGKIVIYNLLLCSTSFTFGSLSCNDGFQRNLGFRRRSRKHRTRNDEIAMGTANGTGLAGLFQRIIVVDEIEAVAGRGLLSGSSPVLDTFWEEVRMSAGTT